MTSDERVKVLERIGRARWHVKNDHARIARLKEMIERHRSGGRDSKPAEDLLAAFEHSQKVFERYLAELERWGR
jgi:chorismate mutase